MYLILLCVVFLLVNSKEQDQTVSIHKLIKDFAVSAGVKMPFFIQQNNLGNL